MRKAVPVLGLIILIASLIGGQEIQHEAAAINIEVPIRVYKGDMFVDNLTITDFEVYEDGELQNVQAVYLIQKTDIERKEERRIFDPKTGRHFYLVFEITEYTPKMGKAIDYFFHNVMSPHDVCTIVTPLKSYTMQGSSLAEVSIQGVIDPMKDILRKEAWMGSSDYRSAVNDVKWAVRTLNQRGDPDAQFRDVHGGLVVTDDTELDEILNIYQAILEKLESMRRVDQRKLLNFADFLKDTEGQKFVYLFYQREFIPKIDPRAFDAFVANYQRDPHIQIMTTSLFALYRRDVSIDVEKVKRAFSDSSISINFLFFSKMAEYSSGIRMDEHSEDVFSIFNDMAVATGGLTESSANPEYLFKKASDATENYYLLYYSPKNYTEDGTFKNIVVKVKGGGVKITHRIGYFAE